MKQQQPYSIHTDIVFGPLEVIDVNALVGSCEKDWFNTTLSKVNDCVVRLGIVKGEFHWHKHDLEDEFFFVLDGHLSIDLEDQGVELYPNQGYLIPKGVLHRTRAAQRTVILMVEGSSVVPTGD